MLNKRYHTITISDGTNTVTHRQFDLIEEPITDAVYFDLGKGYDLKSAETHTLECLLFDLSTLNVARLETWSANKTLVRVQIVGAQTGWNWHEWTALNVFEDARNAMARRVHLKSLVRNANIKRTLGDCAYLVADGCTNPTISQTFCLPSVYTFTPFVTCNAPSLTFTQCTQGTFEFTACNVASAMFEACTPLTATFEPLAACYPANITQTLCTQLTATYTQEAICYPPNFIQENCNKITIE